MHPEQTSVKMDPKKESTEQPWNVVGNNDKSPSIIRDNRVANETCVDKTSIATDLRSPFLRAAKVLPDICDDEDLIKTDNLPDDLKLPSLPEPNDIKFANHLEANANVSIMSTTREVKDVLRKNSPMTNVIVKIFFGQKKLFVFPIIFKKLLDESKGNNFVSFKELHGRIAVHCDDALESRKYKSIFLYDEQTNFGNNINLCLESFDDDLGEFHLSKLTYTESICASYHQHNKIVLHVHCHRNPFYDCDPKIQEFNVKQDKYVYNMMVPKFSSVKHELVPQMIDRPRPQATQHSKYSPAPLNHPVRNKQRSPNNWSQGSNLPISLYEDADFLVKDPDAIVPFGMETKPMRIDQLQSLAYTSIPEISSIVKLLKSHNVSYKKGDNASTWYQKLHNFCNIIGVYLTPPKAMD
jgi:hypothetical protein